MFLIMLLMVSWYVLWGHFSWPEPALIFLQCNHLQCYMSYLPVLVSRWAEVNSSCCFYNWKHGSWGDGFSVQLAPAAEERRWQAEAAAEKGNCVTQLIAHEDKMFAGQIRRNVFHYCHQIVCGVISDFVFWSLLISGSEVASSVGSSQSGSGHWKRRHYGAQTGSKNSLFFFKIVNWLCCLWWAWCHYWICKIVWAVVKVDESVLKCFIGLWRPSAGVFGSEDLFMAWISWNSTNINGAAEC